MSHKFSVLHSKIVHVDIWKLSPYKSQAEQSYSDRGETVDVTQHVFSMVLLSNDTLPWGHELDGL